MRALRIFVWNRSSPAVPLARRTRSRPGMQAGNAGGHRAGRPRVWRDKRPTLDGTRFGKQSTQPHQVQRGQRSSRKLVLPAAHKRPTLG
ncbi:protein of unknown function [Cupriavidus taiwanensis]|nr:protein of unknown function [Cupriavidus taiwanensis]